MRDCWDGNRGRGRRVYVHPGFIAGQGNLGRSFTSITPLTAWRDSETVWNFSVRQEHAIQILLRQLKGRDLGTQAPPIGLLWRPVGY